MRYSGEAVPRHLIFLLNHGEVVIQRGANVVEALLTGEQHTFSDFDRNHEVTDFELQNLKDRGLLVAFDRMTVWLSPERQSNSGMLQYYYLDTKLLPPYLTMVQNLLKIAALSGLYHAQTLMGKVAIMQPGGEPFSSLSDVESALTLVTQALNDHMIDVSIETMEIDPRGGDARRQTTEIDLVRSQPEESLENRVTLAIEHEAETVDMIRLALDTVGVEVRTAFNGKAALEILLDEEPDIVLINLMLTDMHGYEVINKIKKDPSLSRTPIIAMNHLDSEADAIFALHVAKVNDYLRKPLNPNVVRNRVISLLNRGAW